MKEQEPRKEPIGKGELFTLCHPDDETNIFGYGLTMEPNNPSYLVGMLNIDKPIPVSAGWLEAIGELYGGYQLFPTTADSQRGIACKLQIEAESLPYLRRLPSAQSAAIQETLLPLTRHPPRPVFDLRWNAHTGFWIQEMAPPHDLPPELQAVFERTGCGSAAVETKAGIVHACYAADADIDSFGDAPIVSRWQLIKMPTAPLMRLEMAIFDHPSRPYHFESFLNVADPVQLHILAQLASQGKLRLAFYGDGLRYRYSKTIPHTEQQWQQIDDLAEEAVVYWRDLGIQQQNYDLAKASFIEQT